jgi:hypothetical protein
MDELDPSDPDAVCAVTEAIGTSGGAKLMAEVIAERLNGDPEIRSPEDLVSSESQQYIGFGGSSSHQPGSGRETVGFTQDN